MDLQGIDLKKVDPDENGGYDIVTNMKAIGIEDEESPPATIKVNGVEFIRAGRVVGDGDRDMYWSYWNNDASVHSGPAVNLQLWFSEPEGQ
jgi:hypothetical protein